MTEPTDELPDESVAEPSLVLATTLLTSQVTRLTDKLTIVQDQVRKISTLGRVAIALIVLCLGLTGVTGYLYFQNKANQVTSCHNSNESRLAATKLWDEIVDITELGAKSDKDQLNLERLRTWIHGIYMPHDCSQLSKQYPLPPPPVLIQ